MGQLVRLSAGDVGNLLVERAGMPFHVGLLARLEGREASPEALAAAVAGAVEARLALVPKLRQIVVWPRFGCGRPYWCDHERFTIGEHVRHLRVEAPGDEAALLAAVARLDAEILDRERPLWQLWVLTGLASEGAAIYFKMHHAVADGIAAVATLGALLDPPGVGAPPADAHRPWVPSPPPSRWELVEDNARGRARDVARALAYLVHPTASARHLAAVVRSGIAEMAGSRKTPRCSLNRPLGPRRSITTMHVPLAEAKAAAHAAGGSVNDVVLTVVGGGLRALFAARDERPSAPIAVSVPMSMRSAGGDPAGNQVAVQRIPVPVDEADDQRLLARVVETTGARKRLGRVSGYNALASELIPLHLRRWVMDRMATADQKMVNLFVTNVPGPTAPLRLGGRRLLDAYPVAPLAGNVTVGVAVFSYAGELYVVVHADPDANPDVDVMAAGMWRSFGVLLGIREGGQCPRPPTARRERP